MPLLDISLVGRKPEIQKLELCIKLGKNVLLEGPVGVGKTHLALEALKQSKLKVFRVDGDQRYSEQKLTGWFEPSLVLKKGYSKESFISGPLVRAMETGGALFINELNRLPEGVQNVLLPAIDEGFVEIPRLGKVEAKEGFRLIATQNPSEFVATSNLSEALLDRFEWINLSYQSEEEEVQILKEHLKANQLKEDQTLLEKTIELIRFTREDLRFRRGASIRAGISLCEVALGFIQKGTFFEEAFCEAAVMTLPTRVEVEREAQEGKSHQEEKKELILSLAKKALDGELTLKKKK